MEERQMGRSGLRVSALGLGCNNFGGRLDEAASRRVVAAALDHGVTLFDTADVYPMGKGGLSEEILGRSLGARRPDAVVATKFGLREEPEGRRHDGSRRYLMQAVEGSLRRLGTDWIDLLQLHRPDPDTPVDETLRALDDLIRQGKVRYVGCSNLAGWQLVEAHYVARELGVQGFVSAQDQLSLLHRDAEAEILPLCERLGLGFLPFFPLASGLLTGKYRAGEPAPEGTRLAAGSRLATIFLTEERLARTERLAEIAEQAGTDLIDLAFGYLLARPAVSSVIAGASTPEQVARNAAAAAARPAPDLLEAVAAV